MSIDDGRLVAAFVVLSGAIGCGGELIVDLYQCCLVGFVLGGAQNFTMLISWL